MNDPAVKLPKRRPWLLLVIAAAAAVTLYIERDRFLKPRVEAMKDEPAVSAPGTNAPPPAVSAPPAAETNAVSAAPVAPPPPSPALDWIATARELVKNRPTPSSLAEARRLYLDALKSQLDPAAQSAVEDELGAVNVELVTTPLPMPEKEEYVIKSGDSLDRVARQKGTTVNLIQKSNLVRNPNLVKAGDRFRVLVGKFTVVVSKGKNELLVTFNDEFFKRYAVGTGKFGNTPVGQFIISDKIPEPVWWRPDGKEVPFGDKENILGTRWMALKVTGDTPPVRGYGIHGTWDDASIGKWESAGCVRMHNAEVEELFDFLPLGTPVTIVE